jgi:hypothetical protein
VEQEKLYNIVLQVGALCIPCAWHLKFFTYNAKTFYLAAFGCDTRFSIVFPKTKRILKA